MENMSVNKPRLDSVLQMIGIEGGLNFLEQSQSTTEKNQCNPGSFQNSLKLMKTPCKGPLPLLSK